jgi:hypothetical protein
MLKFNGISTKKRRSTVFRHRGFGVIADPDPGGGGTTPTSPSLHVRRTQPTGVAGDIWVKLKDSTVVPSGYTPITTVDELYNMINTNTGGKYILMNDIDMSVGAYATEWSPPNNEFIGTFDGNGHRITNMKMLTQDYRQKGLFGIIGITGVVRNLAVTGVNSTSNDSQGFIAGLNKGLVEFCYADGVNNGASPYSVQGILVGDNQNIIRDCYSTGSISNSSTAGGAIGRNSAGGVIERVYSSSDLGYEGYTSNTNGGVVGQSAGTVVDVFYDDSKNKQVGGYTNNIGAPLTPAQLSDELSFTDFDFMGTWDLSDGVKPKLLVFSPTEYDKVIDTTIDVFKSTGLLDSLHSHDGVEWVKIFSYSYR